VLYLSQPAISAHIKSLEDELGLTLFERTSKGMALTAEGSLLLEKADQLLGLHHGMLAQAKRMKRGLGGILRIGSVRNSSSNVLGALLTFALLPQIVRVVKVANSFPGRDLLALAYRSTSSRAVIPPFLKRTESRG
jgi:DNA-binding transcriptional LysR family regulator